MASKKLEAQRRKRQNQQQRALPQIEALHEELYQRFPNTFFHEPEKISPLKKGIYHDLKDAFPTGAFNTRVLSWTLNRYSRRDAYLRALAEGKPRIDLSGNTAGVVTEDEQQQAVARLKTWRGQRGKPRQVEKTKNQVEGKSCVSDTSGETFTKDQKEPQPTTARPKTTKKRQGKSGEVGKAEAQSEAAPLISGKADQSSGEAVPNDKQQATAQVRTTRKRNNKARQAGKVSK